jgi:hypothetical protein
LAELQTIQQTFADRREEEKKKPERKKVEKNKLFREDKSRVCCIL